jgi:hypothetical protein
MTDHPITPPLSLMQQWKEEWECFTHVENIPTGSNRLAYIAARAAQWGYEQHEKMLLDAMHAVVPQPYEPEAQ